MTRNERRMAYRQTSTTGCWIRGCTCPYLNTCNKSGEKIKGILKHTFPTRLSSLPNMCIRRTENSRRQTRTVSGSGSGRTVVPHLHFCRFAVSAPCRGLLCETLFAKKSMAQHHQIGASIEVDLRARPHMFNCAALSQTAHISYSSPPVNLRLEWENASLDPRSTS